MLIHHPQGDYDNKHVLPRHIVQLVRFMTERRYKADWVLIWHKAHGPKGAWLSINRGKVRAKHVVFEAHRLGFLALGGRYGLTYSVNEAGVALAGLDDAAAVQAVKNAKIADVAA